jgi:phosphoserine aminotransferase
MTKGGKLIEGLFRGETLNTPSMLCVEDAIDALKWMESAGGGAAMVARSDASLAAVTDWVAATPWVDFLPTSADLRSSTSICLKYVEPEVANLSTDDLRAFSKALAGLLEAEGIAFDTNNHRDAPPSLRIWGGATVEPSDMAALLPWLDWSYHETKAALAKAT